MNLYLFAEIAFDYFGWKWWHQVNVCDAIYAERRQSGEVNMDSCVMCNYPELLFHEESPL